MGEKFERPLPQADHGDWQSGCSQQLTEMGEGVPEWQPRGPPSFARSSMACPRLQCQARDARGVEATEFRPRNAWDLCLLSDAIGWEMGEGPSPYRLPCNVTKS